MNSIATPCPSIPPEISAILRSRLDLTADVQVIPVKGEDRTLYQLEHIPLSRRMTMAGLERLCRRIAKTLGAELYGSVNLEFGATGDAGTFAMMAEVEGATEIETEVCWLHGSRNKDGDCGRIVRHAKMCHGEKA
jgi:hypothetical protein